MDLEKAFKSDVSIAYIIKNIPQKLISKQYFRSFVFRNGTKNDFDVAIKRGMKLSKKQKKKYRKMTASIIPPTIPVSSQVQPTIPPALPIVSPVSLAQPFSINPPPLNQQTIKVIWTNPNKTGLQYIEHLNHNLS